ncbi:hypothetical protein [Phytohabitans rumicis]|uniref:Uncharacterized protein n=1 Tax=Phytohabitans rumicis TaxID=1076125 RepID=A0A6V8LDB6_9ACTN|nr:hypothetical protein [Phytohabitans rumicis]GFJ95223.1 hypothetical protein Prum_088650 [Phytohabitans rumicis]
MDNEDFYTTAAQLLAAFAIALIVMLSGVWRRQNERQREALRKRYEALARHVDNEPESPFEPLDVMTVQSFVEYYRQQKLYRAIQCGVALFLAGEAAALVVLLLGVENWITMIAGPIAFLATMALAALAVYIPFSQLPDKPRFGGLLPNTRAIDWAREQYGWPSLKEQKRINRSLRRCPPTSPRDPRISKRASRMNIPANGTTGSQPPT